MKSYPLIYSRTKNDDFVPDFLTRPADLDWQTALKYVKSATANLDTLNDIRYSTFSTGDYCCIGISCITKKLVNQLEETSALSSDKINKSGNYLKDCKGRNIAAFIGFAIPRSEVRSGIIPDIELSEYWEVYQEYLEHQWEKSHTESEKLSCPTVELKEKVYDCLHKPDIETVRQKYIVKGFHDAEQATLDYFFDRIMNHGENVSFISDIVYKSDWDNMYFNHAYVSDALYESISYSAEYENMKTVSRIGIPTGVSSGQTETQVNRHERMIAGYKNSQSTVPVSQEKPLDSGEKYESGGSKKKGLDIPSKFRNNFGSNTGNPHNTSKVKQPNQDSAYYERMIYNQLKERYAEVELNNKVCTISMKKSHKFYESILNMLSSEQVGYKYIENIVFALGEQKIRILFK